MADLRPLIRLNRHQLEQLQKALGELRVEAERLEQQKQDLADRLSREAETAKADHIAACAFLPFRERTKRDQTQLDQALSRVNARITLQLDRIGDAFAELKKLELAQDKREAEHRQKLARQEADELDEIALQRHGRSS
ncbi:MAG: hypothetical protein Alpg2KO_05020 [Alphaproteobacteria bacterium]